MSSPPSWSSSELPVTDVSAPDRHCQTALFTAACRFIEGDKPGPFRLFFDPLANEFAASYGPAMLDAVAREFRTIALSLANQVAVRTKFLDNQLMSALNSGVKQFISLGVGGDYRSSRLPLPADSIVYEVDLPEVLQYREQAIERMKAKVTEDQAPMPSAAKVVTIAADLTNPEWVSSVVAAGFDRSQPCFVLLEGLMMYLPESAANQLLVNLKDLCCPGSTMAGDLLNASNFEHPTGQEQLATWNRWAASPVSGWNEPEQVFQSYGFDCKIREYGQDETCDFGLISDSHKQFYFTDYNRDFNPEIPREFLFTARRIEGNNNPIESSASSETV